MVLRRLAGRLSKRGPLISAGAMRRALRNSRKTPCSAGRGKGFFRSSHCASGSVGHERRPVRYSIESGCAQGDGLSPSTCPAPWAIMLTRSQSSTARSWMGVAVPTMTLSEASLNRFHWTKRIKTCKKIGRWARDPPEPLRRSSAPSDHPLGRRRTWPATAYRRFKPRNLRHRCQRCPTSQPLESHVPDTISSGVETAWPTVRSHHPQIVSRRYSLAPPVRRPQCVAVEDRSRSARPEFNEGKEKDDAEQESPIEDLHLP